MRMHELLDLRIAVPLLAVYLVASDMEEPVRKKFRHLADELVEKFVSALTRGIHCGIKYTKLPPDGIGPRPAGEIRISHKPRRAVARHIELGNHADAAIMGVRNDLANLFLRVVEAIGAHFLQLREPLALNAKSLIVRQVPVEHVQLDRRHRVQIPLDYLDRHEVAAGINHEPAPWEPRLVIDRDRGNGKALGRDL